MVVKPEPDVVVKPEPEMIVKPEPDVVVKPEEPEVVFWNMKKKLPPGVNPPLGQTPHLVLPDRYGAGNPALMYAA